MREFSKRIVNERGSERVRCERDESGVYFVREGE